MPIRPGIHIASTGYRAFVRVHGVLYSRRFPPDTSLTVMQDWRAAQRTDALRAAVRAQDARPKAGTFARDVETYLQAVATMTTYKERAAHLALWVREFGDRPRQDVTAHEIRAVLERWRAEKSESTCNKRRSALMHFYTVLNGKSGSNPARDVARYTEPEPEPRGYPYPVITAILKTLQPSKSRARLQVLAWTGMSPASLMRVQPGDVQGSMLFRRRRQKGRGTRGKAIPLLPQAVTAFTALATVNGFGSFDARALNRVWLRAVDRFIASMREKRPDFSLPRFTVKDLRHSFGTRVYAVTGDLRVAGEPLDHSTLDLTKRYNLTAVDARLAEAVKAVNQSFKPKRVSRPVTTKRKHQSRP